MSNGISIVPRSKWGFNGWNGTVYTVPASVRTEFFVHYEGGTSCIKQVGTSVPLAIHNFHKNGNGWAGIGYNFMIDANGVIYEGRGLNTVGAHCPGHNRTGVSVQLHLGGSDKPTDAMIISCIALRAWVETQLGHKLTAKGHRDGYSTSCPGDNLYKWVHSGMPAPASVGKAPASVTAVPDGLPKGLTLDTDKVVREIQQTCIHYRASDLDGKQITVDGSRGAKTNAAVQRVLNLKAGRLGWKSRVAVDGDFGPKSLALFGAELGYPEGNEQTICGAFQRAIDNGGF